MCDSVEIAKPSRKAALELSIVSFLVKQATDWALQEAQKWANTPCEAIGEFRGGYESALMGYDCKRFFGITYRKVPVFSVSVSSDDPFRFFDKASWLEFRTDMAVRTDWGSIPWTIQKISKKYLRLFPEAFKGSYLIHDGAYYLGGLWCRRNGEAWTFVRMTRSQVDAVLWACLGSEGATNAERLAIISGVRLGAFIPWNQYRANEEQILETGHLASGGDIGDIRLYELSMPHGWVVGRN